MNSLNNDLDLTGDDALKLPDNVTLKPHSATDFSPDAIAKVIEATKGTLFTGLDATENFSPFPCSEARIHCLPCMLHGVGEKGYTISTYFQKHGYKCRRVHPFYQFYCQYLVNNNMDKPPSGNIPFEYQVLMQSPREGVDDDVLSIGSLTGLQSGTGKFTENFFSSLSADVDKLIKKSIKAELESKPSAVDSKLNNEPLVVTGAVVNCVQQESNDDGDSSSVGVEADPTNQQTNKRKASVLSLEAVVPSRMATCSNNNASELTFQF